MASGGTGLFESYEQDYNTLATSINRKLEKQLPNLSGGKLEHRPWWLHPCVEPRKALLRTLEREIEEADEIVCFFLTLLTLMMLNMVCSCTVWKWSWAALLPPPRTVCSPNWNNIEAITNASNRPWFVPGDFMLDYSFFSLVLTWFRPYSNNWFTWSGRNRPRRSLPIAINCWVDLRKHRMSRWLPWNNGNDYLRVHNDWMMQASAWLILIVWPWKQRKLGLLLYKHFETSENKLYEQMKPWMKPIPLLTVMCAFSKIWAEGLASCECFQYSRLILLEWLLIELFPLGL